MDAVTEQHGPGGPQPHRTKRLGVISLCAAAAGVAMSVPLIVSFAVFQWLTGIKPPYMLCLFLFVVLEAIGLVCGVSSRQDRYGRVGLTVSLIALGITALVVLKLTMGGPGPEIEAAGAPEANEPNAPAGPNEVRPPAPEPPETNEPNTAEARPGVSRRPGTVTNSIGMKLAYIPPGRFLMGSPPTEKNRDPDEGPQHSVEISKGFYIGVTEVTQAQWQAVMGSNNSYFKGENLPAEMLSWEQAAEFCRRLSALENKTYRLPTEAEWEYACRAGSTGRFCFGESDSALGEYAWFAENSDSTTHPVATKRPNAYGLYDMHGNVWEWCSDWYDPNYYARSPATDPCGPATGQYRVLRGGSRAHYGRYCRSANRRWVSPTISSSIDGFRVVLEVDE